VASLKLALGWTRGIEGPSGSRTWPSSLPRRRAAQNTYRPHVKVIPGGIELSLSWLSLRRLRLWTTGSIVTGVRVELTESRGSGPRGTPWSLVALPVCVPGPQIAGSVAVHYFGSKASCPPSLSHGLVMFPYTQQDFSSVTAFDLAWRWTDPKWNK